jgi:hypothetical protein
VTSPALRAIYLLSAGWCRVERSFLTAGVGTRSKVALAASLVFFVVLLDTIAGIQGVASSRMGS